jgi:hypothetical protein
LLSPLLPLLPRLYSPITTTATGGALPHVSPLEGRGSKHHCCKGMKLLCYHRIQKGVVVAPLAAPSSKSLFPSPLDPVTTPSLILFVVLPLGPAPGFRGVEPTRHQNLDRPFAAGFKRSVAHALPHPWSALHHRIQQKGWNPWLPCLPHTPPFDPIEGVDGAHGHCILGRLSPRPMLPTKLSPCPLPFAKEKR